MAFGATEWLMSIMMPNVPTKTWHMLTDIKEILPTDNTPIYPRDFPSILCAQGSGNRSASMKSLQHVLLSRGIGGFHRSSPVGGAAYGIP